MQMSRHTVFVLLLSLCYWIWPTVSYLDTGSLMRSATAMSIEIMSSAMLFAAIAILWHR